MLIWVWRNFSAECQWCCCLVTICSCRQCQRSISVLWPGSRCCIYEHAGEGSHQPCAIGFSSSGKQPMYRWFRLIGPAFGDADPRGSLVARWLGSLDFRQKFCLGETCEKRDVWMGRFSRQNEATISGWREKKFWRLGRVGQRSRGFTMDTGFVSCCAFFLVMIITQQMRPPFCERKIGCDVLVGDFWCIAVCHVLSV